MKRVSITFTGDIAFSKYFNKVNNDFLENSVKDFLLQSDYCVGNIEGAFFDKSGPGSEFNHCSPTSTVEKLKDFKCNIWNLGNNHIFDNGIEGYESTKTLATLNEIETIGAGENLDTAIKPILIDNCGGICILSISYPGCKRASHDKEGCCIWDQLEVIKQTIATYKEKYRWCVLVIHGGDEFSELPMPYIRKRYHQFLSIGADIIIGHHPHVVQNYEIIGKKIIFYSLGNFIFDTDYQRAQKHTQYGEIVKIVFSEDHYEWFAKHIEIDRENTFIKEREEIPIFTNINEEEYNRLLAIGARSFLKREKKRKFYLFTKSRIIKQWLRWYKYCYFRFKEPDFRTVFFCSLKTRQLRGKKLKEIKVFLKDY